ncbi:hypothetical protein [Azoarcus olearius]|uniref:Hypothetical secreted protein n=1 Tax=Azoarcus sp. (strain BH72) TaxID=418699 RepID=A1K3L2_AZOSB|nr:hypothetical protein [Azoarcus olearius]CAL93417.1 hypothetical secreted protein [Azoarcus olearius]
MNRRRAWRTHASSYRALVLGAALLLIGGATLAAALTHQEVERAASARLQRELADTSAGIDATRQSLLQLRSDLASYRALLAHGTFGPERTARWADTLARQLATQELGHVSVQFTAARPLLANSPQGLHAATARIAVELSHEEALLDLLDGVAGTADALVIGRGCDVLRRSTNPAPTALHAECEFDWIALSGPGRAP